MAQTQQQLADIDAASFVAAELMRGPDPQPVPGADPQLDALNEFLAEVDYRPDGVTRVWVGARRDGGGIWIGVNVRNAIDNRTGEGKVFATPARFHGDTTDHARVLAYVAWIVGWSAAHEALEFLQHKGELVHDPHGDFPPIVIMPGILMEEAARSDAFRRKAEMEQRVMANLTPSLSHLRTPNRAERRRHQRGR